MELEVKELIELTEVREIFSGFPDELMLKEIEVHRKQITDYLQIGKCDSCTGPDNCYMHRRGFQVVNIHGNYTKATHEVVTSSRRCKYNPHIIEGRSR